MVKVINGTTSPGIGVTASFVRIIPSITQGCLPSSVTNQPVSTAMNPNGEQQTSARNTHLLSGSRRVRHQLQAIHKATASKAEPVPTIMSKDKCTRGTFGHWSRG